MHTCVCFLILLDNFCVSRCASVLIVQYVYRTFLLSQVCCWYYDVHDIIPVTFLCFAWYDASVAGCVDCKIANVFSTVDNYQLSSCTVVYILTMVM